MQMMITDAFNAKTPCMKKVYDSFNTIFYFNDSFVTYLKQNEFNKVLMYPF